MSRMVSFAVLIAVLGVTAVLFYRVMAGFLLPLFLAALLVVMFRPMHQWILTKVRGRKRTAAGLTTSVIFLIVLAPMVLILWQASLESVALFDELQKTDFGDLRDVIDKVDDQLDFLELTDQRKEEIVEELGDSLTGFLKSMKEQGPAVAGKILGGLAVTLAGLAVMMISVYYFLVDGPDMIATVMRLSPLDDRYEQQLLDKFADISRAVVVATLLSAVAQGLLGSIAYWFAGFEAVFLMTALTMLFALVPFVGAAAVWVPASLWLYLHDDRLGAAVALATYGMIVISMSDNLIKPLILHGRSNLHPLLGLLSVLGGVGAMGPIGILVGPMVVVFFQTLLKMLHTEMTTIDETPAQT